MPPAGDVDTHKRRDINTPAPSCVKQLGLSGEEDALQTAGSLP